MDRKEFLRKGLFGTGMIAASAAGLNAMNNQIDEIRPLEPLLAEGFNHLPHTTSNIMTNTVFHPADSRGVANHGWLQSRHTFSFAGYHNPDRMHFGVLRVLNDDIVAAGMGFGKHPHDNMEIISIPLSGDLEHQDSMGNNTVIRNGDKFAAAKKMRPGCLPGVGYDYNQLWGGLLDDTRLPPRSENIAAA